jgi:serine/threonine-protein kinase PRP4
MGRTLVHNLHDLLLTIIFRDKLTTVTEPSDSTLLSTLQIGDEAMLIEERRLKREAIKAKHRRPEFAVPEQVPVVDGRLTPNATVDLSCSSTTGDLTILLPLPLAYRFVPGPPLNPLSPAPNNTVGEESPVALIVCKEDSYIVNGRAGGSGTEDEPSAADYDPTTDMQEDQLRHHQRQFGDEFPSSSYQEKSGSKQDMLLPDNSTENAAKEVPHDEFDMFAEEDELDMFAQAPESAELHTLGRKTAKAVPIPQAKALDMSMLDDWDDQEGYYKVILGELLDGRYHVQSNLGKGMFSGVVRATDQKTTRLVAIKLIRNNETMYIPYCSQLRPEIC